MLQELSLLSAENLVLSVSAEASDAGRALDFVHVKTFESQGSEPPDVSSCVFTLTTLALFCVWSHTGPCLSTDCYLPVKFQSSQPLVLSLLTADSSRT